MALRGVVVLACLAAAVDASASQGLVALQVDEWASPIAKVVSLIKDMKAQTEKEADEDLAAFDKYMCWCITVKKEKQTAIGEAQAAIASLEAIVEEGAAKEGQLKTEIDALQADIASDTDSLASAVALREKEAAEFAIEETDSKGTLDSLTQAIGVLSKASALQMKKSPTAGAHVRAALIQVRNVVKRFPKFQGVMQKDLFDLLGTTQSFMPKLTALTQSEESAKPNGLKGAAAGASSYNSKGGGILGNLKAMGDKAAADLAAAQKADKEALTAFQSLKAAKTGEIASATSQMDMKQTALSDILDKVAKSKEDMESTTAALSADEQLLSETSKGCKEEEEEYAGRTKVRSEEIKALGETLDILTGDDARDSLRKTMTFLQVGSANANANGNAAAAVAMKRILSVATKHKNWALATLAVSMRLDSFGKVKEAMDTMTAELKAQQKAEVEKRTLCIKQIDEKEDLIKAGKQVKEDLDGKHKELVNTIEGLKTQVDGLNNEVSEAQASLKSAGEDRKAANKLYQTSMSDQRATIQILKMALSRLEKFYASKQTVLATVSVHAGAAPAKPAGYTSSASGGGVLQLLSTIIADADATVTELKSTEQQAEKEYAAFVSASNASIEANQASILERQANIASSSSEKSYTEEAQLSKQTELDKLQDLLKATHQECDWIVKYFDVRQKARAEELDAIGQAKAILSGAVFA